jgi:hypothetical protein
MSCIPYVPYGLYLQNKNCPEMRFAVKYAYAAVTLLSDVNLHNYIIRYNSDEYTFMRITICG